MPRNTDDIRKKELIGFIKWKLEGTDEKLEDLISDEEISELTYTELNIWAARNDFVDL